MEHNLTMLYFGKNHSSLYTSCYNTKLSLLSNCLKKYNIESKFYLNDKLGSVCDLIDDLDFFCGDVILIYLDQVNHDYAYTIGKALKDGLEDKRILFLSDSASDEEQEDVIVFTELKKTVNAIGDALEVDMEAEFDLSEVYSIYQNGMLLSTTDIVGVMLDRPYFLDIAENREEYVLEELNYIVSKTQEGQKVYLDSTDITKYIGMDSFQSMLRQFTSIKFVSVAAAHGLTKELLEKIVECGFVELLITVQNDSELESLFQILTEKKYPIHLKLEVELDSLDIEKTIQFLRTLIFYRVITIIDVNMNGMYSKEHEVFTALNMNPEYGRYSALITGMEALFTGMYNDNVADGNVKHLVVRSLQELTEEAFEKLMNYMGLNSAIYYFEKEKTSENQPVRCLEIKEKAKNVNFALQNFIYMKKCDDRYMMYINDEYIMDVYVRKYAEIEKEDTVSPVNKYFALIEDDRDFNLFKQNVEQYYDKGKVTSILTTYQIMDMCRWLDARNCFIQKMPRVLLEDGKLYFCGEHEKAEGSLDELPFETVQNLFVKKDAAEVSRDCLHCARVERCGKCSTFMGTITADQYCGFRKENEGIGMYIQNMRFLGALFNISHVLQGRKVEEFKFFCKNCRDGVEEIENGTKTYLMAGVQIFEDKSTQKYYLCNPVSNGLMALNSTLYFIVKLLMKEVEMEKILEITSNRFNITLEVTKESLRGAFELLRKKGCLVSTTNIE